MNKCKECCITVTFIFYMIFTIICLIFVILDFKIKPNNEIILIPNSNKYDYVFIFMHGLFATPFNFVDKFDKYNLEFFSRESNIK